MLKLFTTQSCTQCPIVIKELNAKEVDYELIDAEGYPHLAAEYNVMSVPTLAEEDGKTHIGTGACLAFINE